MTTEDAFQSHLDAHPDDYTCRLVFADWLEERGDPRAEGYRALGALRLSPKGRFGVTIAGWGHDRNDAIDKTQPFVLPWRWFVATERRRGQGDNKWWRYYASRREAEDAAALAFAKLPAARRAELLAQVPA